MKQKLFSTGNPELDDLLQEVYYSGLEDGYNYAQREFSDDEDDDDDSPRRPEGLEEYSDYDLKHMTRGQMLDALEEEEEKAKRNTKKYVKYHRDREGKKGAEKGEKRGKRSGTIAGSILGGLGAGIGVGAHTGNAKLGLISGAVGAAAGAGLGRLLGKSAGRAAGEEEGKRKGSAKGLKYSREDNHDPDQRAIKLARKMDDEARKKGGNADFESRVQGKIDKREEERKETARRAAELAEKRRQEAREDRIRREKMNWEDRHRFEDRQDAKEARDRAINSGNYSYNENRNNVRIDNNTFNW